MTAKILVFTVILNHLLMLLFRVYPIICPVKFNRKRIKNRPRTEIWIK